MNGKTLIQMWIVAKVFRDSRLREFEGCHKKVKREVNIGKNRFLTGNKTGQQWPNFLIYNIAPNKYKNFDLGDQATSNAKRIKVLVVVSAQEKKRSGNTEGQRSDMIGAGDNSNRRFCFVTDCTKLPTSGMVGWDCGLSTNMFFYDLEKKRHIFTEKVATCMG